MLSSNVLSPTRRTVLAGIAAGGVSAVLKAAPAVARAADLPTTIAEAGTRFRSGDLTSLDLTKAYLTGIEKLEPQLNAFIAVLKEEALKTATERDAELRAGRDRGRLHGVPIVVKDLFEMRGTRTTVGSKAFKDRATDRDATVVRKLLDAGVVVLGKTNMNEFAAGVSGTNATFGDTHNPWNLERSPGGSSSGNWRRDYRRALSWRAWHRYGWIHSGSGILVGHHRDPTDLWAGQPRRRLSKVA
jgi:aspartyl-tRNA(Asn)/glutamyl-tRNA(Gln) amidotransferase subunit A